MGCASNKEDAAYVAGLAIFRKYDFVRLLGKGATSQVHEAQDKESGNCYAIKCIVKEEVDAIGGRASSSDAASKWSLLEHPNVCKLVEIFQDQKLEYLVMELVEGITFFGRLEEEIVLEEPEAGKIAWQMFSAVAHLHSKQICHRDLKPENWLIDDGPKVKLIDFSLVEYCFEDRLSQPVGTLHYLAPDVLRGRYGRPADVWTMGVVLFLALYATYPFEGEDCLSVMTAILGTDPNWSDSAYALSMDAKNLLQQLLNKDEKNRPTATRIMAHSWFRINTARSSIGAGKSGALVRASALMPDGPAKSRIRSSFMVDQSMLSNQLQGSRGGPLSKLFQTQGAKSIRPSSKSSTPNDLHSLLPSVPMQPN